MATIGNVVISVFASTKGLSKSLTSAQKSIGRFAKKAVKTLKRIGTAVGVGIAGAVAASIAIVNKYATVIDKLAKTSSKLGLSVDALQKLQYQAKLTGVSVETMNMALQRMVRRVSEAAKGTGEAKGAIKELGLSAEKLNQLSPDKQFNAIAESMKNISNQGDKVRLAMRIFDTEGVSLVNTMSGNLKQMGAEFDSLGVSITASGAKMVESYQNSKSKMGAIFSGFGVQVTAQLAGPFTILNEAISDSIIKMGGMETVANKVALGIIKAFRGVVDVINAMIKGTNQFELLSKRAELKGAEHRGIIEGGASKLSGGLIGDPTGNQNAINEIKKQIEDLEKPIEALSKIDDFISKMEQKVRDSAPSNNKIDMSDVIKPEHYAAFDKAANDANIMANSTNKAANNANIMADSAKSAAESTNSLAAAANNAANAISQSKTTNIASSKPKAASFNASFANSKSKGFSNPGFSSAGGPGVSSDNKVGSIQDYINASPAGKKIQEMREGGAFSGPKAGAEYMEKQKEMGKIEINMQTDAGKMSGQLLGEPKFVAGLKKFVDKQVSQESSAVGF